MNAKESQPLPMITVVDKNGQLVKVVRQPAPPSPPPPKWKALPKK